MKTEKSAAPEGAANTTKPTTKAGGNIVQHEHYTIKYDPDAVLDFIKTVFHVKRGDIYCQLATRAPKGFGDTPDKIITDRLKRSQAPMAGYYSTSSLEKQDGLLRHTRKAFVAMHVLVLDDIGTKIDAGKFPEALVENYEIESSPGNFQRGFILAEPIEDYEQAQALINLFVDAELTDSGGAMPVKKVRLPCGVNGKPGPNQEFPVALTGEVDPEPWDIQELLDAAGIDIVWSEHIKTLDDMTRRTKRLGSSAWNPDLHYVDPHTGVYDPLLEWLYEQNMVIEDGGADFIEVICPFHELHTHKDLAASLVGYSPLGHGLLPHKRIFHCFHGHGSDHTIKDYLERLHAQGAPLVPDTEYAPENMLKYIYDIANDRVFDCTSEAPTPLKIEAVNRVTPNVFLPAKSGTRAVAPLPLWLKQPSSVKVMGTVHDAASRDRVVTMRGERFFNMASRPTYPNVKIDLEHVNRFLDFLHYLIPEDSTYFIDWLAMKARHPEFRGAAMVLVSQVQGVGKNVMFSLLRELFGVHNATMASMETLIHPTNSFNEHMTSLLCCVSETLALDDPRTIHRAYNKLKDIVDPASDWIEVNYKYGMKTRARTATSFFFFSNNPNAIAIPKSDRRFFVMEGPMRPRSAEYFSELCAWRDAGEWRPHVWNWLLSREIDEAKMYASAPLTKARAEMHDQNTPPIEHVVREAVELWPSPFVPFQIVKELLRKYVVDGVPEDANMRTNWAKRLFNEHTTRANKYLPDTRINKIRHAAKLSAIALLEDDGGVHDARELAVEALANYDETAFKRKLDEKLQSHLDLVGTND
jgi:hypothetical protein